MDSQSLRAAANLPKETTGWDGGKTFLDQVTAPPKKPKDDAPDGKKRAWRELRRHQSSRHVVVEHAHAEMCLWRPLQGYTGRREDYAETHRAITGLVSDRATPPVHSTELVLTQQAVY